MTSGIAQYFQTSCTVPPHASQKDAYHRSSKETRCTREEYIDGRAVWIFYRLGGVAKFVGILEDKMIFAPGDQNVARAQ